MSSQKQSYRLLDSGQGRKLEQVGQYTVDRPCGQAVWEKTLPAEKWHHTHAVFSREGGNSWSYRKNMPNEWIIEIDGIKFHISPTDFGHLGVFPEHRFSWQYITDRIEASGRPLKVLNLFSYSGAASIAAAKAGADVTHVDASQKINDLAKRNAELNGIPGGKIRWITDDVIKYLKREDKRGSKYDGVILDPPSFGRGSKGEVFKIDTHLPEILKLIRNILSQKPAFIVLTCHTPGYTPMTLKNLLYQMMKDFNGASEACELTLDKGETEIPVPAGFFAAWKQTEK